MFNFYVGHRLSVITCIAGHESNINCKQAFLDSFLIVRAGWNNILPRACTWRGHLIKVFAVVFPVKTSRGDGRTQYLRPPRQRAPVNRGALRRFKMFPEGKLRYEDASWRAEELAEYSSNELDRRPDGRTARWSIFGQRTSAALAYSHFRCRS